ncbi:glycosyltransferase [Ekhidna sp.]|uniref:glycosyltransferase n=1 Tax=Ekhidna sp. TaxID=2608089 RepID=UPI003B512BA5
MTQKKMKPLIAIGLGTKERPKMLEQALESLSRIHIPSDLEVILLVCENGSSSSALEIVEKYQSKLPFPASYIKEERVGIVYMRNAILDEARKANVGFLAFFDDDEVVKEDWLVQINNARIKYHADVIQGYVEQKFISDDVDNIVVKHFPGSLDIHSGAELEVASTRNVLIDLSIVYKYDVRFNNRFNLTGGSDTLFFMQLKNKGARIFFCREAEASETIPSSRSTIEWLLSRCFRNGFSKYLISMEIHGKPKAIWIELGYLFKSIRTVLVILFLRKKPVDEPGFQRWKRYNRAKGVLYAMMGVPFAEYKQIHGS